MSLFPTPLYIVDFDDLYFIQNIKIEVLKILQNGEVTGDELCSTTLDDLHNREPFSKLTDIILAEVKLVFENVGLIYDDIYISCMWANISKSKNRHALHLHANSYFSGVLYLDVPSSPGNIGFKDPRAASEMLSFDYKPGSMFKERTIEVEPKTGRLLMFPSWLSHGTKAGNFNDDENRISLSFNILPKVNVQDFSRKISL
jgi:uncharacterized protein (TIGR02466 family)